MGLFSGDSSDEGIRQGLGGNSYSNVDWNAAGVGFGQTSSAQDAMTVDSTSDNGLFGQLLQGLNAGVNAYTSIVRTNSQTGIDEQNAQRKYSNDVGRGAYSRVGYANNGGDGLILLLLIGGALLLLHEG